MAVRVKLPTLLRATAEGQSMVEGKGGGNPTHELLTDRPLWVNVLLWIGTAIWLLYVH